MAHPLLYHVAASIIPAITATSRPGATFFAVQVSIALAIMFDVVTLPATIAWVCSFPAIVLAGFYAILETASMHDPDIDELLRDLNVRHITSSFSAFTSALLFISLGLPPDGLPEAGSLSESVALVASVSSPGEAGLLAVAVSVNLVLSYARSQLIEYLDDLELARVWAWFETGGVTVMLVILPFLPIVVLALAILFALSITVVGLLATGLSKAWDISKRRPCPHCNHPVRVEAILCPSCRHSIPEETSVVQNGSMTHQPSPA